MKFKPPTIDAVKLYAAKAGLPESQAEWFFDHFESNGWMVGGRSPMKSWEAALRNWKRNYDERRYTTNGNGYRKVAENPRNVGICTAGPDYGTLGKLKLQRQDEARQRELQTQLDQQAAGNGSPPP